MQYAYNDEIMLNLGDILDYLDKCRPYGQQQNQVLLLAKLISWSIFMVGLVMALEGKFDSLGWSSPAQKTVVAASSVAVLVGALMIVSIVIVEMAIDIVRTVREIRDGKSIIRRKLETDEAHIRFLLEQSEQSLEYAQAYLKQMTSRTGEWITHGFGPAAAFLPLVALFLSFYKELGVLGWFQSAFIDGHPPNAALTRPIFFVCAVAFLAFAAAYGLLAQQRRNNYKLGLIEMALTLKAVRGNRPRTKTRSRKG